jgi:hypothetical protein
MLGNCKEAAHFPAAQAYKVTCTAAAAAAAAAELVWGFKM